MVVANLNVGHYQIFEFLNEKITFIIFSVLIILKIGRQIWNV